MNNLLAILIMAILTYLIRSLPIILIQGQIKSTFLKSFLHYIPYGILTAMTVPYIFYSTTHFTSALIGTITAVVLALFEKSLITVSLLAVLATYLAEILLV